MGNESTKEQNSAQPQMSHEQIVGIINVSATKAGEHYERSAKSVEIITFVIVAVVIVLAIFSCIN